MKFLLGLGGTTLDGTARAKAGFVGLDDLTRSFDEYDGLAFTVRSCGPGQPYVPGIAVTLDASEDDGSNSRRVFAGMLDDPEASPYELGWTYRYTCRGLKALGDQVTIIGPDGSSSADFNLTPNDDLYLQAQAGRTVAQIVKATLEAPAVAAALIQLGIGNYSGGSLPAQTIADLAPLDIVPPTPVHLSGTGVFLNVEQFIQQWHPEFSVRVEPTGLIRVQSVVGLPTIAITLPGDTGLGDPAELGQYRVSVSGCYTAYRIQGLDIDIFYASKKYGTLVPRWTTANQNKWTKAAFEQALDAADRGNASGGSSTSIAVTSDDPTAKWDAQFWANNGGVIKLLNTTITPGTTVSETRTVTSCTALVPGGSATITWDSSVPLTNSGYNRYELKGLNSPLALVDRYYDIVGLTYPVYPRFPFGVWPANLSSKNQVTTPIAVVTWSPDHGGKPPYQEFSIPVQLDRDNKRAILRQPPVTLSAPDQTIQYRYPLSEADGLPRDVVVDVPYNRGELHADAPVSGFSGTAFTKYGIQRTFVHPIDAFTNKADLASYRKLAAAKLRTLQDAVIVGSVTYHGVPTSFDPFQLGKALLLTVAGTTNPDLDGIPLPVRAIRCKLPNEGPDLITFTFEFSNFQRPFDGDAIYSHPSYATGDGGFGYDTGAIGGGSVGGLLGMFGSNVGDFGLRGGDLGDDSGDLGAGEWKAGGRASARQNQVDATAKANRALRSPAEAAEKRRLANNALAEHAPVIASPEPTSPADLLADARANNRQRKAPADGIAGVDPPPDDLDRMGGM